MGIIESFERVDRAGEKHDGLVEWSLDYKRCFGDIKRLQAELSGKAGFDGLIISSASRQTIKFLIGHFVRNRRLCGDYGEQEGENDK